MSKHGNNNARWVLLSESQNLNYYARNLSEHAHKMRSDADFNILDKEGQETVHEMIKRMKKTISELKTILPKGDGTGDSPPDTQ